MKSSPGEVLRYASMAVTGQRHVWVQPTNRDTPFLVRSVLEALIFILSLEVGVAWLSTRISCGNRCHVVSKVMAGAVNRKRQRIQGSMPPTTCNPEGFLPARCVKMYDVIDR